MENNTRQELFFPSLPVLYLVALHFSEYIKKITTEYKNK